MWRGLRIAGRSGSRASKHHLSAHDNRVALQAGGVSDGISPLVVTVAVVLDTEPGGTEESRRNHRQRIQREAGRNEDAGRIGRIAVRIVEVVANTGREMRSELLGESAVGPDLAKVAR